MQRTNKIAFSLLFFFCIFLTFNKHSKDKAKSYHGVIWADAAGYYVYNPMWFIYGNNASNFPDSIEVQIGNGFQLNPESNKVFTKYPSGVAILQIPFFLTSHILAEPLGYKADGFSRIYSFGLFFAGIFYCCLGLFFLSKFLSRYFSSTITIAAPLLFLAGTNLFYYTIDAPGMSHVYSFFLFSVIIYLSPIITTKASFKHYLVFFVCLFLAVLCRPTNILIGLFPFFYCVKNRNEIIERIKFILSQKFTLLFTFAIALFVLIPQFIYWHNTTGHFLSYSYKNEGFDFLTSPKFLEIWFSTNNGLFTYSPLILLAVVGIVLMIKNKKLEGYFYGFFFLLISYIFASWWCWWYGCSFGSRSFIEYYVILMIPFCYLLQQSMKNKVSRTVILVLIGFCCYLNMDMEYYYDGCFYGGTWDFATYLKLLNS